MELSAKQHTRIDILDAARALSLFYMVIYHAAYDITIIFGFQSQLYTLLQPFEPLSSGTFILLAGISCRFSHSNFRRAIRILLIAAAITVITAAFLPEQAIWFGVLHFIGIGILLFIPLSHFLDRISSRISLPILLVLFLFTFQLPFKGTVGLPYILQFSLPTAAFSSPFLFWLGFPQPSFASADYFPLIPWLFLLLIGSIIGKPIKSHQFSSLFYTIRLPVLAGIGRHTLLVYVLHQPILFSIIYCFFSVSQSH